MRNLRLRRENNGLWSLLWSVLATGRWECDVFWVANQPLDALPKFDCRFVRVETESNYFSVIWEGERSQLESVCFVKFTWLTTRKTHCVKSWSGNLVIWQVIDCILPQSKARPSFCQHERNTRWTSTAGWSFIVQQDRYAREDQPPILLPHTLVEICEGWANVNLSEGKTSTCWLGRELYCDWWLRIGLHNYKGKRFFGRFLATLKGFKPFRCKIPSKITEKPCLWRRFAFFLMQKNIFLPCLSLLWGRVRRKVTFTIFLRRKSFIVL